MSRPLPEFSSVGWDLFLRLGASIKDELLRTESILGVHGKRTATSRRIVQEQIVILNNMIGPLMSFRNKFSKVADGEVRAQWDESTSQQVALSLQPSILDRSDHLSTGTNGSAAEAASLTQIALATLLFLETLSLTTLSHEEHRHIFPILLVGIQVAESLLSSLRATSNSLCPMVSLPPEILTNVLTWLSIIDPIVSNRHPKSVGWLCWTSVCFRFREVALSHAALWADSFASIPGQEPLYKSRAGILPLSLIVSQMFKMITTSNHHIFTLLDYLKDVGTVDVIGNTGVVHRRIFLSPPLPKLEHLYLDNNPVGVRDSLYNSEGQTPLVFNGLSTLHLKNIFFTIRAPRLVRLTVELHSVNATIVSVPRLLNLIHAAPDLTYLYTDLVGIGKQDVEHRQSVCLSRLQSVTLTAKISIVCAIISLITFTTLAHVNIKMFSLNSIRHNGHLTTLFGALCKDLTMLFQANGYLDDLPVKYVAFHDSFIPDYLCVSLDPSPDFRAHLPGQKIDQVKVTIPGTVTWMTLGGCLPVSVLRETETLHLCIDVKSLKPAVNWDSVFAPFSNLRCLVIEYKGRRFKDVLESITTCRTKLRGSGCTMLPSLLRLLVDGVTYKSIVMNGDSRFPT
ncbi:hypothetical protein OF83DRAFT_1084749 [Amylostereum chailletii]|nr:hypothetical protein OF83DRAFT_1084749 [Amylostereum chailletii]